MPFCRVLRIAALLAMFAPLSLVAQFAHTQKTEIVDGSGRPLLLRGTSLGNWMVTEGLHVALRGRSAIGARD